MRSSAIASATLHPSPDRRAAARHIQRRIGQTAHRTLSVLLAIAVATALAPWLCVRAVWGRLQTGRWVDSEAVLGRHGKTLQRYRFAGPVIGASLAGLWHIATGDYAWVGPRPIRFGDLGSLSARDLVRLEVNPGLVSVSTVRERMGLAHDGVARLERSMALDGRRLDAGLLARAVFASCVGQARPEPSAQLDVFRLFGVDIDDRTMGEALEELIDAAKSKRHCRVAFVNPDCLNRAFTDVEYRSALSGATRVYADGIGVRLAARWRDQPLRDNVNGTDLFPRLCERAAQERLSLFFLGARPGVAGATADNMTARFPRLRIAGTHHGYFTAEEEPAVCREIAESGADIVLVAFGAPRQDLWLARHHAALGAPVTLGVGGLFDFYSGRVARAPEAWRELGLEWVFRLTREPGRLWRRYVIGNPLFVARTLTRADRRLDSTQR